VKRSTKNEIKSWLAVYLLLIMVLLVCFLIWSAVAPAFAEGEVIRYPIAYVDVSYGYLNVRKTPAGELTNTRLRAYTDVVILATQGDWALVINERDMGLRHIKDPLGWVHREYITVYRDFIELANK
jgi:hypothetical protein